MLTELADGVRASYLPALYSCPSVQQFMVYDVRRVARYRRAIRATVMPGDVAVDLGTGTGLLAFLCLQAGAVRVHAIEREPRALEWAGRLAEANGMADRMVFHAGDSHSVEIGERADVLVSELIGVLAFDEGMVETQFDAIDRFLRPGGRVIPRAVTLVAALARADWTYARNVDGWLPAYGLDFSAMREPALRTPYPVQLREADVCSTPVRAFNLDFDRGERPASSFSGDVLATKSGLAHGVAFWFEADLAEGVSLGSGPGCPTHWGQILVPVPHPLQTRLGECRRIEIDLRLPPHGDPGCELAVRVSDATA